MTAGSWHDPLRPHYFISFPVHSLYDHLATRSSCITSTWVLECTKAFAPRLYCFFFCSTMPIAVGISPRCLRVPPLPCAPLLLVSFFFFFLFYIYLHTPSLSLSYSHTCITWTLALGHTTSRFSFGTDDSLFTTKKVMGASKNENQIFLFFSSGNGSFSWDAPLLG